MARRAEARGTQLAGLYWLNEFQPRQQPHGGGQRSRTQRRLNAARAGVVGKLIAEFAGAAADNGLAVSEQVISRAETRLREKRSRREARKPERSDRCVPLHAGPRRLAAKCRVIGSRVPDGQTGTARKPVSHMVETETVGQGQPAARPSRILGEERILIVLRCSAVGPPLYCSNWSTRAVTQSASGLPVLVAPQFSNSAVPCRASCGPTGGLLVPGEIPIETSLQRVRAQNLTHVVRNVRRVGETCRSRPGSPCRRRCSPKYPAKPSQLNRFGICGV